jgi:molybdopterin-biosynthesis enzyme MoeA-like protein
VNFYTCIIGTELLNGRRSDAHFAFVNQELLRRGWSHKSSFIIDDDPDHIARVFSLVKSDPHSVMFCFGGIGSTPDDYTREVAAKVFTRGKMRVHPDALALIVERFGDEAYPYRVKMANLPSGASLLPNPVNNVPGFSVEDRFFFVPGFPQMAHPMITYALENFYKEGMGVCRMTLTAYVSENDLIPLMEEVNDTVSLSSLPFMAGELRRTVISLSSTNSDEVKASFSKFQEGLNALRIPFSVGDHLS